VKAAGFCQNSTTPCPLSLHQVETCAEVLNGNSEVISNEGATGDGKSLAAHIAGLLTPQFRSIGLYPTIELVSDQEKQVKRYCKDFGLSQTVEIDSLYGAELARRVEAAEKGNKFKELWRSLKQSSIILTNPDIFHLITHFRYRNPAYNRNELPITLARSPDLYIADEFHISGPHQEAAILNSLLFIRHSRSRKRPLKALFTSATPKQTFVENLSQAGFHVRRIKGQYTGAEQAGYRQICQPVHLEFVQLDGDTDSLKWLLEQAPLIRQVLTREGAGRGLIILNSIAQVSRVVRTLQAVFTESEIKVREISGRIDRLERERIQNDLFNAPQSVLVVATSAVDVGVDFRIHLLIFETSDAATFIQRLGRLGRHPGFSRYEAFVLIPSRAPWIMPRLQEQLAEGQEISRIRSAETELDFREIIESAFDPPREFEQYRAYWGALQAQGMLITMSRGNADVMQPLQEKIAADLRRIYGDQLNKKRGHWHCLGKDKVGELVQEELLRFRGGSDLQAAIWDDSRFYSYDLLRILPYVAVEVVDRASFLGAAQQHHHAATEFDECYITVYFRVQRWLDERQPIELQTDLGPEKIQQCTLSQVGKLTITGHPQAEVRNCLRKQKLLVFLVEVNRKSQQSHWEVAKKLRLSPLFGLYRLTDADGRAYACAFNQDALLLEALKWRLKPCENSEPYIF
jgi:CRISPR-associated endonuclease/helicase Cas3